MANFAMGRVSPVVMEVYVLKISVTFNKRILKNIIKNK